MTYKSLIITEKPSVAMDFVKVLGEFTKHDGFYESDKYVITWAYGHLVELADPEDYNPALKRWSRNSLPIIPDQFKYKVISGKYKQFKVIKQLIHRKDIGEIINAGDPGREGCLLQRLIYQQADNKKPVKRFWTSSALSPETIQKTMQHLRPASDFNGLYESALARQQADWLIGISGTRAFTIALGDLYSIGRVQTCILALLVRRQKEIEVFKPQDYWVVFADTDRNIRFIWVKCGENYKDCTVKVHTKEEAESITALLTNQTAIVKKVFSEDKTEYSPGLFSLTTLQQEANRLFGFSAQKTLNVAQSLYEKHFCSYPRTESQYLDETEATKRNCGKIIEFLKSKGFPTDKASLNVGKKVFNNSKLTDHHAFIPQIPDKTVSLSLDEKRIFDLVARRFIAAFSPPYKYTQITVFALANNQTLKTEGKIVKDKGWRAIYNFYAEKSSVFPSKLKEGEKVKLLKVWDEKKQTEPPPKYTEGSLLKVMTNAYRLVTNKELKKILKENTGIGTPATRSQIIETLIKRDYVTRKGKALIPTEKGVFIVDNLNGSQITKPDYTALWEQRLEEISQGKETKRRFMTDIIAYTKELIEFSDTLKNQQDKVLQEVKNNMGNRNNVLGRCPLCGSDVIQTSKAYSCSDWKKNNCKFVIWKNIAKKKITPAQARKLIAGKKVAVKGFTSRAGKKFNAYLIYDKDENKVSFAGFF